MENTNFLILILTLDIVNFVLHSIGLHYLRILYPGWRNKQQRLLIANLSLCEALCSILFATQEIIFINGPKTDDVSIYIQINTTVGLNLVFYASIIFITLDRLLHVVFRGTHEHYCTLFLTKCLIGTLWLTAFLLNIFFCCAYGITGEYYESWIIKYILPALDGIFLIITSTSYTTIIVISKRSSQSVGVELKRAPFVMASLLVLSFVLFIIVPDITSTVYRSQRINMEELLWYFLAILYRLSITSDAILYILLSYDIRRSLYCKFKNLFNLAERHQHSLVAKVEEI